MQMDLFTAPAASPELASLPPAAQLLQHWLDSRQLRALDVALARFCLQLASDQHEVALLAALLSRQLQDGHVCLRLDSLAQELQQAASADDSASPARWWASRPLAQWLELLQNSPLVSSGADSPPAPLVLQHQRLYLYRMWRHETAVAQAVGQRLAQRYPLDAGFTAALNQLFVTPVAGNDWQKIACAMAASGNFTLITGGPGTGKTTTVVRLLALLQQQALAQDKPPLHIRLAAPTGKAAARLGESIGGQIAALPVTEAVRAAIPDQVGTLHRLLGSLPDTRSFRHHAGNPLQLDVLVVDEASMIDLEMMDNLLQALPPHARLILLGDKDQLASVEAGAVMGELCLHAAAGRYTADTLQHLQQLCGSPLDSQGLEPGTAERDALEQRTVMLRHSRRFAGDSGIGRLAAAVNAMDVAGTLTLLRQPLPDVHWPKAGRGTLQELVRAGFAPYIERLHQMPPAEADVACWHDWAAQLLRDFDRFRLLCALREGDWGVQGLNQLVEQSLADTLVKAADSPWYAGRPVMVTRNDYGLGLMNGDIGIAIALPDGLRVAFARNDGSGAVRLVLPSRLTAVDTVFAMTVHKSQGSEFDHCALVLPDVPSPVLTKELLYTGITRARQQLTLLTPVEGVLRQAIGAQVIRHSGLRCWHYAGAD
ncbi:MAG: exodeoxyribonuclease V subunit alpha [Thiopseudomonas sp.]|nr:exodeoxyribonuclease V subunit alpha [Thiopseudomonas sp.]